MKAPARDRDAAGRGLSGAPRAGLSGRLYAVARAVAQVAGSPLGRPRAVRGAAARLRARGRDRGVQDRTSTGRSRRLLATAKGEDVRARLTPRRKRLEKLDIKDGASATPSRRHRKAATSASPRSRRRRSAQPVRAVHDLDAAAGSLAQARLLGAPDHAGGAAPLRRRRHRRRDGRPHHLYANRRRADRARGDRGDPRASSIGTSASATCRRSAASTRPRPRTPRRRTRRSGRPM